MEYHATAAAAQEAPQKHLIVLELRQLQTSFVSPVIALHSVEGRTDIVLPGCDLVLESVAVEGDEDPLDGLQVSDADQRLATQPEAQQPQQSLTIADHLPNAL